VSSQRRRSRRGRASRGKSGVRPGAVIQVRAFKSDGLAYRWWRARVESCDADHIATFNRIGDVVEGTERGWKHRHNHRNIYWFGRPYTLTEAYERDGRLKQLYVHIASPPVLEDHTLRYIDHELDVIWRPGQEPRVADQDEFIVAAARYGYSPDFQAACWRAVEEALHLVSSWKPIGPSLPAR
jgi:protein associated with RNAse G/E